MKYALISEDQIEKFNSAIELAKDARYEAKREHYLNDAILIIESLKPSEPDAFMTYKGHLLHALDPAVLEHSEPTPLYALDEVTDERT